MADLAAFLASVSAFSALDPGELEAVAARCEERTVPAGATLLTAGTRNGTLFVLRSGQVAVRRRNGRRGETLAQLGPPAVLGEISFLTGRPCSADIDVVVDATFVALPLEALATLAGPHERIVQALAGVLADRLHGVVTGTTPSALAPVLLVEPCRAWAAPRAFRLELARALARETGGHVLIVDVGVGGASTPVELAPGVAAAALSGGEPAALRREAAARLSEWSGRFAAIVLAGPAGCEARALEPVAPFATHRCWLVGPGDALPEPDGSSALIAQDARRPTLPVLDGAHRLVADLVEAESALASGHAAPARFRSGVEALARSALGLQVGVALGAGGARGWCHVGVLAELQAAGLPIDVIAGTSMGAFVGGLWATGADAPSLETTAAEWHRHRRRLREWRFWRMHMASERRLDELFRRFFGDRAVNTAEIPFWANATDIERGDEVVLRSGPLRQVARASMAFPGWTPPVRVAGRLLVDGAVVDPVPAHAVREMGAAFVVAVLAIGPYAPTPLATRFPARIYDTFARTFQLSGVAMGMARGESDGDQVVVPDLGDATMLSFERYRALIEAGRTAARAQLPAILAAYAELRRARRPAGGRS